MLLGAPGIATRSILTTSIKKLGARMLLGAPGIATRRSILTSSNKKLLGAPGFTTRSKDATRGSWHRY